MTDNELHEDEPLLEELIIIAKNTAIAKLPKKYVDFAGSVASEALQRYSENSEHTEIENPQGWVTNAARYEALVLTRILNRLDDRIERISAHLANVDEAPKVDPENLQIKREKQEGYELMIRAATAVLENRHRKLFLEYYLHLQEHKEAPSDVKLAEICEVPPLHINREKDYVFEIVRMVSDLVRHPRIRFQRVLFVELLEEMVGTPKEDFAGMIEKAVTWAEEHSEEPDENSLTDMGRVSVLLRDTWEAVQQGPVRPSHLDNAKKRVVATCAAYVTLSDDHTPDGGEGGLADDYQVVSAVRSVLELKNLDKTTTWETLFND